MVFVSARKLEDATNLIQNFQHGTLSKTTTDEQLWQARKGTGTPPHTHVHTSDG